ncbi:MAG: carbohydrate ABC transporter permease, partial [Ruminococcus sp.]|nr:carbohydrate ABC transporter permease [Ruminococcus sp.]
MIYKTFFQGIPMSLKEAARIDGASHFKVLIRIIIPLSKPLLATMALFSIVGHWNSYFSALLYLN